MLRILGVLACVGILSATLGRGSFGAGSWIWWLGVFAAVPLAGYVPWILWLSRFREEASFRNRQREVLDQLEHVDAEIDSGYARLRAIDRDLADGAGGALDQEREQEMRLLSEKERDIVDLGRDLAERRLRWLDEQATAFEVLAAEGTLEKAPALPRAILEALEDQIERAQQWRDEHEDPAESDEPWRAALDRLGTLRAAFTRGRERLESVRRTRNRRAGRTGTASEPAELEPRPMGAHSVLDAVDAQLEALPDLDSLETTNRASTCA